MAKPCMAASPGTLIVAQRLFGEYLKSHVPLNESTG